jgi:predicted esterase
MTSFSFSQGSYSLVIEGYDWGPSVNKLIIHLNKSIDSLDNSEFSAFVSRSISKNGKEFILEYGKRNIQKSYISDSKGKMIDKGSNITLVLEVGPHLTIDSPFHFDGMNQWVDYEVTIKNELSLKIWDTEINRIIPLVDDFSLDGEFLMSNDEGMNYAFYTPKNTPGNSHPLIIWLHGGGEGGKDTSIPLLANLVTNYASAEIQQIFGGAYVLVPQSPTRWMDAGDNSPPTNGEKDDIYFKDLKRLFEKILEENPNIDKNRIYLGGCSNGGYMSLKLLLEYPEFFTASFISSLAYKSIYLNNDQLEIIKDKPIWFVHSKDDFITKPDETAVPIYNRLIQSGAKNVHLSLYDHVIDISNMFGGESFRYPGHLSWIYLHANKPMIDFDGTPVKIKGLPVSIMQWLAFQKTGDN